MTEYLSKLQSLCEENAQLKVGESQLYQVINKEESLQTKSGSWIHRPILSDGFAWQSVLVDSWDPRLNLEANKQPIINVKRVTWNQKYVYVKEYDVLYADYGQKIGNPIPYQLYKERGFVNENGNNQVCHQKKIVTVKSQKKNPDQAVKVNKVNKPIQQLEKRDTNLPDYMPLKRVPALPIKDLYPGMDGFAIEAKVIEKTATTQFKSGKGCFFSIQMVDRDGSKIKGTFFNEAARQFEDKIEIGKSYYFSKGQVKMNRYSSNSGGNQYEISFESYSIVDECENIRVDVGQVDLLEIANILDMSAESRVDLIAVVKEESKMIQQKLKNGEQKARRNYLLVDRTGIIEFTLWGLHAENHDYKAGQIMAIKQARIGTFQEQKNLQMTASTLIETDPKKLGQFPIYLQMIDFAQEVRQGEIQFDQPQKPIQQDEFASLKYIEDMGEQNINDPQYKLKREVKAMFVTISQKNLCFSQCPHCRKKVEKVGNSQNGTCRNCNKDYAEPNWSYLATAKIVDASGQLWVTLNDGTGLKILGKDAKSFQNMAEQEQNKAIKSGCFKVHRMLISTKIDEFNNQTRARHSLLKIFDNIDYKKEAEFYADEITKQLNL